MNRDERISAFCTEIWSWYARHKRTLPWRDLTVKDDTQRAYMVLVSEVMLQQTQVSRVTVIFRRFLREFPALQDLARASNRAVIMAWRGMGYNSRALRLRDAARIICDRHGGKFPCDVASLRSIPGIGPYTAAAILNFAFNIPTPCVDTNIRRILHRTFFGPENVDGTWRVSDEKLLQLAQEVLKVAVSVSFSSIPRPLPPMEEGGRVLMNDKAGRNNNYKQHTSPSSPGGGVRGGGGNKQDTKNWHAALMDYGSLVCTKNNPRWAMCPLTKLGIMVTTKARYERARMRTQHLRKDALTCGERSRTRGRLIKKEPGRDIAGKHVPNRIIRGRIVEFLRDQPHGSALHDIGAHVCIDWDAKEHRAWLQKILRALERDRLVERSGRRIRLAA